MKVWQRTTILLALLCWPAQAQTTAFTYQGKLTDSSQPANGTYDFQFKLFDALNAGAQVGSTVASNSVAVSNGVFTVTLDFGANAFPGAARFLEISVRQGAAAFTMLGPRQPVTATPYAIQTLNATQLGSVSANQYVLTSDARLSDARPPTAGSANYIQNTAAQQASSNFNISSNGTAGGTLSSNLVNAVTQYNLNANRILSNPGTGNLFAGVSAGSANTTGTFNTYFGFQAGSSNTTGSFNTFLGVNAGFSNTASGNAFFGQNAGFANTTGGSNAFFGQNAGSSNTTGSGNAFFGQSAGSNNTTDTFNTAIGINADFSASNLTNGTAIGSGAIVNASNKVRIGNTAVTVIEGQVAYSFTSDRNQKEYFRPVNGEEVLRKLRGFNLTSWNYIGQDPQAFRHYGPMAQDFYAAFGKDEIGTIGTPTTINSGDLSGVMLSAIQELSIENEAMKAEAGNRRAEISSQQKQLEALQQQLSAQRQQIAALKALVCQTHPQAAVCKEQ